MALTDRWKKQNAPGTRRTKSHALKAVLLYLNQLGAPDLVRSIPRPPAYRPRIVTATPEEMNKLLTKSQPWMRLFILLCGQLGLRFREAARACPLHWQRERNEIAVTGKNNKVRSLPLTPELTEMFTIAARLDAPADTPFLWLMLAKPCSVGPNVGSLLRDDNHIRKEWQRMKRKLGINPALVIHDLRRTRITQVYRETLDITAAQHFADHDNLATTANYIAPFDSRAMKDLLARLPSWKQ